jgi:hypothetical protein
MWTYEVSGEYALIYKNGTLDWKMGPWDVVSNPDGPGKWAEELCKYRNENPNWDQPVVSE